MDVKEDLKKIISEHLERVVSAIFLDKSLTIMDGSTHERESLLAAADRIGKRIAMFIDKELAAKVSDILTMEIETRELTPGTRRRHRRVGLNIELFVTHNGMPYKLYTGNLSQGGVFIKTAEPFPSGSDVTLSIPLEKERRIHVKGVVVYTNAPSAGITKRQPGMAVKFTEVGEAERKTLMSLARRLGEQTLSHDQGGTALKPSLEND